MGDDERKDRNDAEVIRRLRARADAAEAELRRLRAVVDSAVTWNRPEQPWPHTHYVWDADEGCPLGWVPVCRRCEQGPLASGDEEAMGVCSDCFRELPQLDVSGDMGGHEFAHPDIEHVDAGHPDEEDDRG